MGFAPPPRDGFAFVVMSANPVCKFFWSGPTDSLTIEGDQTQ
jgi:hypothetical protein